MLTSEQNLFIVFSSLVAKIHPELCEYIFNADQKHSAADVAGVVGVVTSVLNNLKSQQRNERNLVFKSSLDQPLLSLLQLLLLLLLMLLLLLLLLLLMLLLLFTKRPNRQKKNYDATAATSLGS